MLRGEHLHRARRGGGGGVRELRNTAQNRAELRAELRGVPELLLLMLLGGELRLHLRLHLRLELRARGRRPAPAPRAAAAAPVRARRARRQHVGAARTSAGAAAPPPTPGSCGSCGGGRAAAPPIAPAPGGHAGGGEGDVHRRRRGGAVGEGDGLMPPPIGGEGTRRSRGGRASARSPSARPARSGQLPGCGAKGSAADGGGAQRQRAARRRAPSAACSGRPAPRATDPAAARRPGAAPSHELRLRLPSGSSSPAPTAAEFSAPLPFPA